MMSIEAQRQHQARMQADPQYRADALAERRRIGAIVRHGLSRGLHDTALSLALDSDLDAAAACRVLDTLPPPVAASAELVAPATDFAAHLARVTACGRVALTDGDLETMLARARTREGRGDAEAPEVTPPRLAGPPDDDAEALLRRARRREGRG